MALNIANVKTPGVYIDEVSLLPPSVAGVETGIPAFVGYTSKVTTSSGDDISFKPMRVSSYAEFEAVFGGPQKENDGLKVIIKDYVAKVEAEEAKDVLIKREMRASVDTPDKISKHILSYAIQLYFANGGGPCYIVSTGAHLESEKPAVADLTKGVDVLAMEDEPTMIVVPELALLEVSEAAPVYQKALDQAAKLQDRVVILDVKQKNAKPESAALSNDVKSDLDEFRKFFAENGRYGAAYYPYLNTTIDFSYLGDNVTIEHTRIPSIGDPKPGKYNGVKLESDLNPPASAAAVAGTPSKRDNLMYNIIRDLLTAVPMQMPSSAAIAAVYAKTDAERGVWKAPANVGLSAVSGPNIKIDDEIQRDMNVDANGGKSVNAIRSITGRGTVVWGARTLDGNSNEWRYINVRRFFNFVEESVKKSTQRFVFEPNDANTWVRVRAMVENFLTLQWRAGALQGEKPEQAFFVNVGLGKTMTALDILEGRMIVEIGMAAVRPAEFIILRFSHKMAEA